MTVKNFFLALTTFLIAALLAGCGDTEGTPAPAPPESILISPSPATVSVGETRQFAATCYFSNDTSSICTASVLWTSSDESAGTIDANSGLFAAVATGTTNITATFQNKTSDPVTATVSSNAEKNFIRASGRQIIVGQNNQPIRLRGVLFNNDWWADRDFIINQSPHHTEIDFQRVADMGMNVIRFGLTYKLFEDDSNPYYYPQEAWDWLDRQISYAKAQGLYLIFVMQRPQVDFQECNEGGNQLWQNAEYRNRLKSLWKAIATRYRDETTVAGYNLVNEPCPPDGPGHWQTFAQELVDEIRTVDTNHLIVIEKPLNGSLFLVDDDNVMYDAHPYINQEYCLQYGIGEGDGGYYPDPLKGVNPWSINFYSDAVYSIDTGSVPAGDSDWALYESGLYQVTDDRVILATPMLISDTNQGSIFFDDFTIYEYDANGDPVREMHTDIEDSNEAWALNLNLDTEGVFHYPTNNWASLGDQGFPGMQGSHSAQNTGHLGSYSMVITGASDGHRLFAYGLMMDVKNGYSYRIAGWMKGAGVTGGAGRFSLVFYDLPDSEAKIPFDKNYLESKILEMMGDFGEDNNVPLIAGEFGLNKWAFYSNIGGYAGNRGGLTWVSDMIDIFNEHGINYTYVMYHIDGLGIYWGNNTLPDPSNANQELIDLFIQLHQ